MHDRSIPMISLAMKADTLENMPAFDLPEGYSWRYYQPGDEQIWAQIETSAGEFEAVEGGIAGFHHYYPETDQLDGRMIFLTENGVPFATATAWFGDDDPNEGRLHWVSVDEPHQGRGLSWPLVSMTMHRMRKLGHQTAYLTTQTASWVAIRVYHRFGFRPDVREEKEIEGWRIVSEKTGIDFMKDIQK